MSFDFKSEAYHRKMTVYVLINTILFTTLITQVPYEYIYIGYILVLLMPFGLKFIVKYDGDVKYDAWWKKYVFIPWNAYSSYYSVVWHLILFSVFRMRKKLD